MELTSLARPCRFPIRAAPPIYRRKNQAVSAEVLAYCLNKAGRYLYERGHGQGSRANRGIAQEEAPVLDVVTISSYNVNYSEPEYLYVRLLGPLRSE